MFFSHQIMLIPVWMHWLCNERGYFDHPLIARAIPADPSQVLQCNVCPSSILCYIFSSIKFYGSAREHWDVSSWPIIGRPGALWNQNLLHPNLGEPFICGTATNMQAVHSGCSLSSLFLRSSRFPFVVCPVSDISARPSGRKDSRETCEVRSPSCFSSALLPFPLQHPRQWLVLWFSTKSKLLVVASALSQIVSSLVNPKDYFNSWSALVIKGRVICISLPPTEPEYINPANLLILPFNSFPPSPFIPLSPVACFFSHIPFSEQKSQKWDVLNRPCESSKWRWMGLLRIQIVFDILTGTVLLFHCLVLNTRA